MTDPTSNPDSPPAVDCATPPGMPRWVKVTGIVVGILILLFVVLQLTGVAGQHGPGRHFSGNGQSVSTAPTAWSVAASPAR